MSWAPQALGRLIAIGPHNGGVGRFIRSAMAKCTLMIGTAFTGIATPECSAFVMAHWINKKLLDQSDVEQGNGLRAHCHYGVEKSTKCQEEILGHGDTAPDCLFGGIESFLPDDNKRWL